MRFFYGTNYVLDDEPCFSLSEIVRQSPDSKGLHRYQVIQVLRDDRIVEFERDLGLSKNYKKDPFIIPGGVRTKKGGEILHNVGELIDIADQVNDIKLWDKKDLAQNNSIREKY